MAAQAHGLLVHRRLVRVDRGLGDDARLVDVRALEHLAHACEQLFAGTRDALGRALLDLADQRLDDRSAVSDVLRELFALALTHLVEAVAGLGKYGQNVLRQLIRVLLDALRAEHIGELSRGS